MRRIGTRVAATKNDLAQKLVVALVVIPILLPPEAPLTMTIETHASSEPVATTRRSVSGLRRMVDGIRLA
jgi:hypothetical protein